MQQKQTRNSKPKIDLTGQQFGRWTALEYVKPGKWKCQCSCENHTIKLVEGRNLRSGKSLSCGCLQKERTSIANSIDLTGQRFGSLVAKKRIRENKITYYICECDCGNITKVDSRNLQSGHTISCGCIKSKGEKAIATFLKKYNIKFIKEKIFEDCIDKQPLKFDFYIPSKNLLIEYDGEQHFQISRFGNKSIEEATEKFKLQQKHDQIKNEWCLKNNIELLRISYKDYKNIDKILGEKINGTTIL